jgi:hypothetical protein
MLRSFAVQCTRRREQDDRQGHNQLGGSMSVSGAEIVSSNATPAFKMGSKDAVAVQMYAVTPSWEIHLHNKTELFSDIACMSGHFHEPLLLLQSFKKRTLLLLLRVAMGICNRSPKLLHKRPATLAPGLRRRCKYAIFNHTSRNTS